jgi:Zn-dependent protease with chaperone function
VLDQTRGGVATLQELCEDPLAAETSSCEQDRNLALLSRVSVAAALGGLGLFGVIALAGYVAQKRRVLLAFIFRPLLLLTVAALIVLVLIHAAIAVVAAFYAEVVLVGRIDLRTVIVPIIAGLASIAAVARAVVPFAMRPKIVVLGKAVSEVEQPRIWEFITDLAEGVGITRPHNIVLGLNPTFFVTEATLLTPTKRLAGRTLYLSLPLCRTFSESELTAVIGHELGHFKGDDTLYSRRFYPIYRGTRDALAALERNDSSVAAIVLALPAVALLEYLHDSFQLAERAVSRKRELAADQLGASLASPMELATALAKLHVYVPAWTKLEEVIETMVLLGKPEQNLSTLFYGVIPSPSDIDLEAVAGSAQAHPTNSHPTFAARLNALGVELDDVVEQVAYFDDYTLEQGIELIDGADEIEEYLTQAYLRAAGFKLGLRSAVQSEA